MEQLTQHIPEYMLTAAGLVVTYYLRRAIKLFRSAGETRIKADLAFEEVSERLPEYERRYKTWASHR